MNSIKNYFFFTDPPQPPEIKGYTEGETIRMGQTVNLECVSYGGNPLATITWYLFLIVNKKQTKKTRLF